ncbi:hypothetical protein [Prauserella cavernicola]|uniref:Uncharacterized protein n=1 Tax=Prauserella cavernicola TaxID=2800127 RepID=A0A934QQ83_9PSEU|nr:hypothetical protein [Prauserella cavernicola]MBK1784187.1 hypothetical protein [Prauserella cavernicola]
MSDVVWPAVPGYSNERLNQPWRLVVAAVELLVAAAGVWIAFLVWDASLTFVTVRLDDGTELVSRVYSGNWVALAIALGGIAGILVVDAIRQTLLGFRTGRRRYRKSRDADHTDQVTEA